MCIRDSGGSGCRPCRRFFHHHVSVGAADAERADARTSWRVGFNVPILECVVDGERRSGERHGRVWRTEMRDRRQFPLAQRQRGLDHSGGASGDQQVADVALDRADAAEADVLSTAPERAGQALSLIHI